MKRDWIRSAARAWRLQLLLPQDRNSDKPVMTLRPPQNRNLGDSMFKTFLSLALLPLFLATAARAEPSPAEQFKAAMATFLPSGPEFNTMWKTHQLITANLEGRWNIGAEMFLGGNSEIMPETFARACEKLGADVKVTRYQIKLRRVFKRKGKDDGIVETVYSDLGGGTYVLYTDPEAYLDRLGLADVKDESLQQTRYMSLRFHAGIVSIYRPSADVLVIAPIAGRPSIMVRCQ
jgi:hypothetical protein